MSGELKSLAMMKMEKNFRAVIEKGYPRKPYEYFALDFLLRRAQQELDELKEAVAKGDLYNAQWECADVSNIIDYVFEGIIRKKEVGKSE